MRAWIAVSAVISLALLVGCGLAHGQTPVIVYPAGAYTITTPAPTTITQTVNSITISWGPTPTPTPVPVPVPPTPIPIPPAPAPVPVLTGKFWAVIIYDPTVTLPTAQTQILTDPTIVNTELFQDVTVQVSKITDANVATYVANYPIVKFPAAYPMLLLVQTSPTNPLQGTIPYGPVPLPTTEASLMTILTEARGAPAKGAKHP